MRALGMLKTAVWGGLLLAQTAHAAVSGSIEGVVTEQSTNKPLAGVTVTATSPALQGEQTEFTDASGRYIITELPPGEYTVRFYFSNLNIERAGVFLNADTTLRVSVAIPTYHAEVKVYRVTERAPTVDVGNTQVQTLVTNELVHNVPIPGVNGRRTYESVLTLAPGSTTDQVGFVFNGATGPENNYLIDGANTTQPAFGLLGTELSLEFIRETEIITGGYNAEYGRATGGVVNVITKSGSNDFRGSAWFFYTPFSLEPERVSRLGEAITSRTKLKRAFDFGFDLGGPILKDRIWFYVGFAPTFTTTQSDRILRQRQANNVPAGQMGDYAGDIDTNANCPSWLARELCTGGGYLTQDLPSRYTRSYNTDRRLYNWIAKLNVQLNPNHALTLQYIGSPYSRDGVPGNYAGVPSTTVNSFNGAESNFLSSTSNQTHDVLAHLVSKLLERRLQLDVLAGFHIETEKVEPTGANGNLAGNTDTRTSPLSRFEMVDPCAPQMVAGGGTFNPCPVANYGDGGYGLLTDRTNSRFSAAASATYFLRLGGTHALKLGGDFEDNMYRSHRFFTGGASGGLYTTFADTSVQRQQYGTLLNAGTANEMVTLLPGGFTASTSTLNEAIYLRDSYNVGLVRGLTLNAGVRWELEQIRDVKGTTVISLNDNIAPRLGFIYDWTKSGRSKLYASYGRFYESVPLDLNDRQFSGEGFIIQQAPAGGCMSNMNGRIDPSTCMFPAATRGNLNGGTYAAVSPVLKGQYSNEVVAGAQYDVGWDLVVGAAYIHRDLGRIIEDLSPDGGQDYIIANPSEPTDPDKVKDLQNQIARTGDPMRKAALQKTLSLYQQVYSYDKPKRDYNALVITANKRLTHNIILLTSYTYSRTLGNYPGLYQASNNQLDPNISTQYDLRELMVNRYGPLPNDRPHNLKVTGAYTHPLTAADSLTLGINFNALSGRPIEVLGRHPIYGPNETFILPRGSGGRTPTITAFDLHLAYARQVSKLIRVEVVWDIFNLFNQHQVTDVDDQFSFDPVAPLVNGTVADLRYLKTVNGGIPNINANYGRPTGYQAPLSMRFGVRASF